MRWPVHFYFHVQVSAGASHSIPCHLPHFWINNRHTTRSAFLFLTPVKHIPTPTSEPYICAITFHSIAPYLCQAFLLQCPLPILYLPHHCPPILSFKHNQCPVSTHNDHQLMALRQLSPSPTTSFPLDEAKILRWFIYLIRHCHPASVPKADAKSSSVPTTSSFSFILSQSAPLRLPFNTLFFVSNEHPLQYSRCSPVSC